MIPSHPVGPGDAATPCPDTAPAPGEACTQAPNCAARTGAAEMLTGGPVDPRTAPVMTETGLVTAGACTGAENCAARTGRWNRLRTLDGTPTTSTANGMVWNRKCPATGCPIRTYHP